LARSQSDASAGGLLGQTSGEPMQTRTLSQSFRLRQVRWSLVSLYGAAVFVGLAFWYAIARLLLTLF
jgi:hypothetical protein